MYFVRTMIAGGSIHRPTMNNVTLIDPIHAFNATIIAAGMVIPDDLGLHGSKNPIFSNI